MRRAILIPATIGLGALLGILAGPGSSDAAGPAGEHCGAGALQDPASPQVIAPPMPAPSAPRTSSPEADGGPVNGLRETAPELPIPSAAGGSSTLIATLLFEKYRPFRHSLTSP